MNQGALSRYSAFNQQGEELATVMAGDAAEANRLLQSKLGTLQAEVKPTLSRAPIGTLFEAHSLDADGNHIPLLNILAKDRAQAYFKANRDLRQTYGGAINLDVWISTGCQLRQLPLNLIDCTKSRRIKPVETPTPKEIVERERTSKVKAAGNIDSTQLASEFGIQPKALRKWLRANGFQGCQDGGRYSWAPDSEELAKLRAQYIAYLEKRSR